VSLPAGEQRLNVELFQLQTHSGHISSENGQNFEGAKDILGPVFFGGRVIFFLHRIDATVSV